MCDYCFQVKLVENFYSPDDYEKTIVYIKELIEEYGFVLIDGNCKIGKHKDKNGCWIDDIISHTIKCPKCGQNFICIANTYKGGGSFKKGDKLPFSRKICFRFGNFFSSLNAKIWREK